MRSFATISPFALAVAALIAACGDSGSASNDAAPPGDAAPHPDGGQDPACALAQPFDERQTYERTLWVATDGDPSGDGSEADPLPSLDLAAEQATPGTRIIVGEGTYSGSTFIDGPSGEPDRPIAFVADGEVILDAAGETEALHMVEPRWVVLQGFTVTGATVNGINIDDGGTFDTPAGPLVLRGMTVHDIGTGGNNDCIKLSGVDDFQVLGSEMWSCDAGNTVDMVGCHDGVIAGNLFHDTPRGLQLKGGTARVLAHGNVFRDVPGRAVNAGGSTGLAFFRPQDAPYEAADLRIVANVFERVGDASGAPIAYVGCDGCTFANNTVIDPRTWIARILQETVDPSRFVPSRDGLFVNNLVVLNVDSLSTYVNVGPDTAPETFIFGHNLWYALDRDASWEGPTYSGGVPPETMSVIQEDPLLQDRASGDFRPMSGSPAAAVGTTDVPGWPYPDFDGRCYADPPAAGAFVLP